MEEEEAIEVEVMGEEAGWNGRETQEEIEEDVAGIVDSCSENISNKMESTSENKSFLMANVESTVDCMNDSVEMDDSTATKKSIPMVNDDSLQKNSILRNSPNSEAKGGETSRCINSAIYVDNTASLVEKIRWVNHAICVVKDETVKREHIFIVNENKQNLTESEDKMVETQNILPNHGDRAEKNRTVSEGRWENILLEPTDSAQNNRQLQVDHADSTRDIKIAMVEHPDISEFIPMEHKDTIEENIPAESATNNGENLNSGIEDQCITQEDKDFLWKVWTA